MLLFSEVFSLNMGLGKTRKMNYLNQEYSPFLNGPLDS